MKETIIKIAPPLAGLILIIPIILIVLFAFYGLELKVTELPDWIQAVGSVYSIFSVFYLFWYQTAYENIKKEVSLNNSIKNYSKNVESLVTQIIRIDEDADLLHKFTKKEIPMEVPPYIATETILEDCASKFLIYSLKSLVDKIVELEIAMNSDSKRVTTIFKIQRRLEYFPPLIEEYEKLSNENKINEARKILRKIKYRALAVGILNEQLKESIAKLH